MFQHASKKQSAFRQIADVQVKKAGKKAKRVFPGAEAETVKKVEDKQVDATSVQTQDTCGSSAQDVEESKLNLSIELKSLEDVEVKEEPKLQAGAKPFTPAPTVGQLEYQGAVLQNLVWTNYYNLCRFAAFREQHLAMEQAFRKAQAARYVDGARTARFLLEAGGNSVYRVTDAYLAKQVTAAIREFVDHLAPAGRAQWITSMITTLSDDDLFEVLSSYDSLEARVHEAASMLEALNEDYLEQSAWVTGAVSAGYTSYYTAGSLRYVSVDLKQSIKPFVSQLLDDQKCKKKVLGVLANLPSDRVLNFLGSVDALKVEVERAVRLLKAD